MGQKFCVLPGQEPVRIAKTDGRVVIIGEELRDIPEDMVNDAFAKGAISEERLASIKKSLLGDGGAKAKDEGGGSGGGKELTPEERTEAIKNAVLQVVTEANPEDFTGAGNNKKPKVEPIEKILGFDITATERDTAFALVSAE